MKIESMIQWLNSHPDWLVTIRDDDRLICANVIHNVKFEAGESSLTSGKDEICVVNEGCYDWMPDHWDIWEIVSQDEDHITVRYLTDYEYVMTWEKLFLEKDE